MVILLSTLQQWVFEKLDQKKGAYLFIQKVGLKAKLVGELAGNYSTVVLMFGFAVAAMAPALVISRMLSPRKRSNPVKFLPPASHDPKNVKILFFVDLAIR